MPINDKSILESIKLPLNIPIEDTDFDEELIMHINSAFFELYQLGVGPLAAAYSIEDSTAKWVDFFGAIPNLMSVKTYIYMWVRLIYDPPPTSYAIESYQRQLEELKWRLKEETTAPPMLPSSTPFSIPIFEPAFEFKVYHTGADNG